MLTTIIHRAELDAGSIDAITRAIPGELEARGSHYRLYHRKAVGEDTLSRLRTTLPVDINPLPPAFDPAVVRLVVSDMDSTLIAIECLDELAEAVGLRKQLAELTSVTMRGEADFAVSLRRRVAMLKGLPLEAVDGLCRQHLALSPGAEAMLAGLRQRAIPVALVTGGFVQIARYLQQTLGLAFCHGIEPEVSGGVLTGMLPEKLIDAEAKAEYLRNLRRELSLEPLQVIALGDGANDLPMLQSAGLGIAYRGKPLVQAATTVQLDHSGLEAVLDFIQ